MKIIDLSAISARTANPRPEALSGYSLEKELRTAVKTAVKPLQKRLGHYRAEVARLNEACAKWSNEAHEQKLNELTARAHAGDSEAESAIQSGAVPSKQSYAEMHGRYARELENFERESRALFAEVLPLITEPMTKAVDRGQEILDHVLEGLGIPRFTLEGWRNHVSYVLLQVEHASKNQTADMAWFWQAIEA